MADKESLIKLVGSSTPYIIGGIVLMVLFLLLSKFVMATMLIISMIALALVTKIIPILRHVGLEIATFTTIVFGLSFGPFWGAVAGFFLVTFQLLLGGYINVYVLWVIPSYVIAGFVAGTLAGSSIVTTGFMIYIVLQAVLVLFTALVTPAALAKFIPYVFFSFIVNYFLFTVLGPVIMKIMI